MSFLPFKIGITGGMGSGKSFVSWLLKQKGYLVYPADERAKWLIQNDPSLIAQLKELLGEDIYNSAGELNRQRMAQKIFRNATLLQKVNAIVHPTVRKDFSRWIEENSTEKFLFKEAAITLETYNQDQLDYIVLIYAPKRIRIQRVLQRDSAELLSVLDRMSRQWPDRLKSNYVDYVVFNDNTHSLEKQVVELLDFLNVALDRKLKEAKNKK